MDKISFLTEQKISVLATFDLLHLPLFLPVSTQHLLSTSMLSPCSKCGIYPLAPQTQTKSDTFRFALDTLPWFQKGAFSCFQIIANWNWFLFLSLTSTHTSTHTLILLHVCSIFVLVHLTSIPGLHMLKMLEAKTKTGLILARLPSKNLMASHCFFFFFSCAIVHRATQERQHGGL